MLRQNPAGVIHLALWSSTSQRLFKKSLLSDCDLTSNATKQPQKKGPEGCQGQVGRSHWSADFPTSPLGSRLLWWFSITKWSTSSRGTAKQTTE